MHIEIPDDVKMIMGKLNSSGFKAYVVGGAIRNSLLGIKAKDWDITTSAKPDDMLKVFEHLHFTQTGIKHGTITVVLNGNGYEVTTFRKDGDYSDNRHPDSVEFVDDLSIDLSRRDFTINAMAYNDEEGLIDLFGGLNDINNRIIKCVGNPDNRFQEDALRMMRAIRFGAQLNFFPEKETRESIRKNSNLITNVSKERISAEISKILVSDHPDRIVHFRVLGIMKYIIPCLDDCFDVEQNNQWHVYSVGTHIIQSLLHSDSNDFETRLALMLHDVGKVIAKTTDENGIDHFYQHNIESAKLANDWMREYKFDSTTIDNVTKLVLHHDYFYEPTKKSVKKMLNMVGLELTEKLIEIRKADVLSQNTHFIDERFAKIELLKSFIKEVVDSQEAFQVRDLEIDGNDLISIGFKQGKELGNCLKELMDIVLDNPEMNTKDILLGLAKDKISILS